MNYALRQLLNMKVTRFRDAIPASVVNGVTVENFGSTGDQAPVTGCIYHVQPLTPDETVRAYGYEAVGTRWEGWALVDGDFLTGDMIKVTEVQGSTGAAFVGLKFIIRGHPDDTLVPGIQHQHHSLELTEKST